MSESVIMDKACREVTRDYNKILSFIGKENDEAKKDSLMTLWHQIKCFIDLYDGADAEVRTGRQYAKHVVHVYEMMLRQQTGRKVLMVTIAGIVTPETMYYGFWGTCRGISTAEMQILETYVDKMRRQAATPLPSLENATIDDEDDTATSGDIKDGASYEAGTARQGTAGTTQMGTGQTESDTVVTRDATIGQAIAGDAAVDVINSSAQSTNDTVKSVTGLTIDDIIERVVKQTNNLLDARERNEDTIMADEQPADVQMESAGENGREETEIIGMEPDIGWKNPDAIERTMDDSGMISNSSQLLPQPNVTIDVLDNNQDTFSEDSWFDQHAQELLQSTPAAQPAPPTLIGKISIEITKKGYIFYCDKWLKKVFFNNFGYLQRFLYDTVKGPTGNTWYTQGKKIQRKNYRGVYVDNFPNFVFENQDSEICPEPAQNVAIELDNAYYSVPIRRPLVTRNKYRNLEKLNAQQRRANYRRQNALRQPSPNTNNRRLHNRKGSRGTNGWHGNPDGSIIYSLDEETQTDAIEIPLEDLPLDQFPREFENEVREMQQRLRRLEARFKD